LFIVEKGILSYYKIRGSSMLNSNNTLIEAENNNEKTLKCSFSLRGYSIEKTLGHEMYLWTTKSGMEGKDLKLHTSDNPVENAYPMKIWVAAIRCHIRFATDSFSKKFNWFPYYQAVTLQDPTAFNTFYKKRLFQVIRRDGVNIEKEFDENIPKFVSFLRYHEIIEITEMLLNRHNNCRGKLANDDGWVTINTVDGSIILNELIPTAENESGKGTRVDIGELEEEDQPSSNGAISSPKKVNGVVDEHLITSFNDSAISESPSVFTFPEKKCISTDGKN
jgi:hypothetical protein